MKPVKKVSPSVRTIFGNLERLINSGQKVTPALLTVESGFSYSAEISAQFQFMYNEGYVGRAKEGSKTILSILKPLPPMEPRK